MFEFRFKFHWKRVFSQGTNWQYASIGSNNGLALTTQQAIIWTNDGLVYWRIYASLSLNELKIKPASIDVFSPDQVGHAPDLPSSTQLVCACGAHER